jgi:hypothetical protein
MLRLGRAAVAVAVALVATACHQPEAIRRVRICGAARALCWSECNRTVVERGGVPATEKPTPCIEACGAGFDHCNAEAALSCSGEASCGALDADACTRFVAGCTPRCPEVTDSPCPRACANALLACNACVPYLSPR